MKNLRNFLFLSVIFFASNVFAKGGGAHYTEIIGGAPIWVLMAFEGMCVMLVASLVIMMIINVTGHPRKVSCWIDSLEVKYVIMYLASASISGIVLGSLFSLILWALGIKIQL